MSNLTQTVMDDFPADGISKLAGILGKSPGLTVSSLMAAVPALFAGALQRSSTTAGASDLLGLVKNATADGNPVDRLSSVLSDDRAREAYIAKGHGLADSLLGGQSRAVATELNSSTHIGGGSAATILALVAPLVLGVIGRSAGSVKSVSGLQSWFANERGGILKTVPSGVSSILGMASAPAAAAAEAGANRHMLWIAAALAAVLLFFGVRYFSAMKAPTNLATMTLHLPGGGTLDVIQGSIGSNVGRFLESSDPAPKTFVFDNLNFDTASNALTLESKPTITALSTILKAYPSAQIRVVGYTDNQGAPAANLTLSDARAATVKQELVNSGIAADRIATAGMGEQNPIADNGSEEGRAKNRRTELEIVKK
ncbi:MAG TPA: OmpA family protein [Rhizomicrobium sp.]|nr:OmpA family protein [Rhizomicrobium sp.]